MKQILLLILLSGLLFTQAFSQSTSSNAEGSVTFITSQNVYVRFTSTEGIQQGDTLKQNINGRLQPALVVNSKSSTSCVCTPLAGIKVKVNDKISASITIVSQEQANKPVEKPATQPLDKPTVAKADSASTKNATATSNERKEQIRGRISVASYSNLTNTPSGNSQRMRYTVSLNARNINNGRLSAESYISFSHRSKQWGDIKQNIFNGLKIYNLALTYDIGKNARLSAGRRVNPNISNMGAVDGIQFELKTNEFTTGIVAGTRPDYRDYGFNTSLLQYGLFVSHEHKWSGGNFQTSAAVIEQDNKGNTDRRFAYIQHTNYFSKSFSFFGSAEFDMYRLVNEVKDNAPRLSNLYASFRYRYHSWLNASVSYSTRENVIYYETYKTMLEQLLQSETTQGYLLQLNVRPLKKLSVGATGGYRFRKSDPRPSKNVYAYATYSQIPGINASASIMATLMETSYMNGKIFGGNLSRDLVKGKLSTTIGYKYIDYRFVQSQSGQKQHVGEISFNWRIMKKLSAAAYYEGTFEQKYTLNRIYVQLSKSF